MLINKIMTIVVVLIVFSASALGAADGMEETSDYITGGAKIFGLIMVILINAIWLVFPMGLGYISYGYFKRKSEQAQEDLGVKAGLAVFFSFIIGALGAYYIVGSIGKSAMSDGGTTTYTLKDGNEFMISNFIGSIIDAFAEDLNPGTTGTDTTAAQTTN
ncbi:MAG: Unknown protein [uncultured Sulfurovum sp.]|uniref:Uncharacterized protein n=1 Tax=uncultured Sulfurovum sp. TaxID=269237 RepID=A0A6S6SW59_9BACT|nr:MAG: Unknown protein [uncultured Sulfurovum sp.]